MAVQSAPLSLIDSAEQPASHRPALPAIILCGLAMIVEGFDTYAVGYVGPAIAKEWAMSQTQVGLVYSIGIASSLAGSVLFGGLADRFGRRRLLTIATVMFGLATLLGAAAGSVELLVVSRLLAGIGLGASVPCAMALATEAASPKRRASVPVLMSGAIGSGMIVASLAAAAVMPAHGWRGLMIVGGLLPLIIALPMPWVLVETRRRAVAAGEPAPWRAFLEPHIATMALVVTLAMFATYLVTFFFGFWLPTLIQPVAQDIRAVGMGMTVIKTASLLGSIVIALALPRFGPGRVLPLAFLAAAAVLALGVRDRGGYVETIAMLTVVSFFVDGAFSGIIGFGAWVFPDRVRATSIGLTTGLARLSGGTLGPMIGGVLLDHQFGLRGIALSAALPLVVAGALVALAAGMHRRGGEAA